MAGPKYRELLQRPEGFEAFYRLHSAALLRYFARRVYDPQVAFDLTAETFAQAFLSRHRFRGHDDQQAGAWLYVIARRQLGRYYRRGRAERRALNRLGLETPPLSDEELARTEELAELDALRDAVRVGLAELTAEHREVLRLRVVEERGYAEIAAELGVSEQTVRARVSRALRALGRAIDRDAISEEAPA